MYGDSDEYSLRWQERYVSKKKRMRGPLMAGGNLVRQGSRPAPHHSAQDMGACVNALRTIVFIFNLLFWVTGLIILGLGLWLLLDPTASDFFALHSTHPVGWLLVAAGAIMTFIGCFWMLWRLETQPMRSFCILPAAVIAYNKQDNIRQYIESSMYDTIQNRYASDVNYKTAFDSIQNEFQCCGVKSYNDWLNASWDKKGAQYYEDGRVEHGIGAVGGGRGNGFGRVPSSCCNEHGKSVYPSNCGVSFTQAPLVTYSQFVNQQGCADALYESWYNYLDVIIGICVFVGAIQLIGMVFSMILCCCVNAEKKKYDY
ncbi:unnamed protein product [Caenorhabditis auriculariae]|uniref:Tetraspanin n=1 Tax=Caenorhabditis auriculariae TaxID=2777116 RepID=A0A8S1GRA9_9PELO|nr:unnamed protein product [Caenorhabditis auriculariae]